MPDRPCLVLLDAVAVEHDAAEDEIARLLELIQSASPEQLRQIRQVAEILLQPTLVSA